MKRRIKLLSLILCAVLGLIFFGCRYNPGRFYTLQEAYDNCFLAKEDLIVVAQHHNNNDQVAEELDEEVKKIIQEIAQFLDKDVPKVEKLDNSHYNIRCYYGCYNGCYVFIYKSPYIEFPAVQLDEYEYVDGVAFHYQNPLRICCYKKV